MITSTGNVAHCLNAGGMGRQDFETETMVAFPITAGMAASAARMPHEQGALLPICFNSREDPEVTYDRAGALGSSSPQSQAIAMPVAFRDVAQALTSNYGKQADNSDTALGPNIVVQPAVAFDMRGREGGAQFEGPHDTANIRAASGGSSKSYVAQEWAVRRLTPTECERLQGFPDNFTNVPWGKKDTSPDGPRYKALGNSMAVNVMRWIGRRIEMVEKITKGEAA